MGILNANKISKIITSMFIAPFIDKRIMPRRAEPFFEGHKKELGRGNMAVGMIEADLRTSILVF
jgi:hypothetical protein